MTARFTVSIICELVTAKDCHKRYPPDFPTQGTAKALRVEARDAGWETVRGTAGRDVCPLCRIVEIQAAARRTVTGSAIGGGPLPKVAEKVTPGSSGRK